MIHPRSGRSLLSLRNLSKSPQSLGAQRGVPHQGRRFAETHTGLPAPTSLTMTSTVPGVPPYATSTALLSLTRSILWAFAHNLLADEITPRRVVRRGRGVGVFCCPCSSFHL